MDMASAVTALADAFGDSDVEFRAVLAAFSEASRAWDRSSEAYRRGDGEEADRLGQEARELSDKHKAMAIMYRRRAEGVSIQ